MAKKTPIQNGLPTLESEVALQDFETGLAESQSKKGRPKGAKNVAVDTADAPASRCPKCFSTRRTPYFNRRDVAVAGVDHHTGKPYTSIVLRRTKCEDCGQHRDDRQLVNEPDARGA